MYSKYTESSGTCWKEALHLVFYLINFIQVDETVFHIKMLLVAQFTMLQVPKEALASVQQMSSQALAVQMLTLANHQQTIR